MADGAYEQFFVRNPATDKLHSAWTTFPHLQELSMNDLYTRHPSKPNLWLFSGRADDAIALSNGEKINPGTMESTIQEHPNVKGVLVVGQSRFAPAAIVELREEVARTLDTPEKKAVFLESEIWPIVMKVNESAPAHAQLSLDRVILSDVEKPFARAAKGTMQRGVTVKLYAEEIEEIYSRGEDGQDVVNFPKLDVHGDLKLAIEDLKAQLGVLIESVVKVTTLDSEQDFFAMGMDSLHVMTLVRLLKNVLVGIPLENINTRLVYSNPSLSRLASALKTISGNDIADAVHDTSREEEMLRILDQFTSQIPRDEVHTPRELKRHEQSTSQLVVLLTGSTGSLGSYLLHTFLSSPKVSKVYCLNRSPDAAEIQIKGNLAKGLISTWDNRVDFLHADLSKPKLGLDENTYSRLQQEVSIIIRKPILHSFSTLARLRANIKQTINGQSLSTSHSPPSFPTSKESPTSSPYPHTPSPNPQYSSPPA